VAGEALLPYERDEETLARPWIRPGTPGGEHRIGGLEKQDGTGNVSYDPANHEAMVRTRQAKVDGIAHDIPDEAIFGPTRGDTLLVGWGGTFGALRAAVLELQERGIQVSHMHLRHIRPLARNVEATLKAFERVIVCELNLGQLRTYLNSLYDVKLEGFSKMRGQPFHVSEVIARIQGNAEGSS
jgi:2-oxoglutarate ferredoxin oxidoreductase subunit alpha